MRRYLQTERDRLDAIAELSGMSLPLTVTAKEGKNRTLSQNALAWKWAQEIAAYFGDRAANEVHAHNKLHYGVPILRETDPDFCAVYDERIKPLTYDAKMALMAAPIDLPVTRSMKAAEMTRFMDAVRTAWTAEGVTLTDPEELRWRDG